MHSDAQRESPATSVGFDRPVLRTYSLIQSYSFATGFYEKAHHGICSHTRAGLLHLELDRNISIPSRLDPSDEQPSCDIARMVSSHINYGAHANKIDWALFGIATGLCYLTITTTPISNINLTSHENSCRHSSPMLPRAIRPWKLRRSRPR
jgi:hypothetical protein